MRLPCLPPSFFDDDANNNKVPIDSSHKLVDKVSLQTPPVFSHFKLLTDEVDGRKMASKDSKIHATRSVIDDHTPTLDSKETNDPFLKVCSSLARNTQEINKQNTASLTIQTQLNDMVGQFE